MWTSSRNLHQLWSPVIRTIANKLNVIPVTTYGILPKYFHALTVPAVQRNVLHIVSPIALDTQCQLLRQPIIALPMINQTCGFKLKRILKRRCKDCYFVVRQDRLHVICKTHPRHKQMAITRPEKSTVILTHATQSKIRPW